MKRLLTFCHAAMFCCMAFSQNQNINWVFGDSAGLNFSGVGPEYFHTNIATYETCASVSDSTGNLLFYTNGEKVWNKSNEIMNNGDSLIIGGTSGGLFNSSITQGVVVVENPSFHNQYYLIEMFQIYNPGADDSFGLSYSLIDLDLYGGLGGVVEKNISFYEGIYREKMQAVRHANGRDWWVVIQTARPSDTILPFIKFLITPEGIGNPIQQVIGPGMPSPGYGNQGQMKFSQDGTRLVVTRGRYFDLYDFDRCTGELSNCITVQASDPEYSLLYGCEFSPDARWVYFTSFYSINKCYLYQFCVNCPGPIIDTKSIIYELNSSVYYLGQMQLGPDNKIYVATPAAVVPSDIYSYQNQNLNVIQNPNGDAATCNFDTLVVSLGDARSTYALPNLPNYNLGALEGSECDTLTSVIGQPVLRELQVFPNPASNYLTISATDEILLLANINAITITTLSGGVVKTIRQPKTLTIYTGDLTAGFYLVTLTFQSGEAQNFKIIIQ
jgi:hypothetical protein